MNNKQKTLAINTLGFIVGGMETLIIRMFRWAHENGYRNVLIMNDDGRYDEIWTKSLDEMKIERYYVKVDYPWKLPKNNRGDNLTFSEGEDVILISTYRGNFISSGFIDLYYKRANIQNYFYILHPDFLKCSSNNKILKMLFRYFVLPKISEKNLLFMDKSGIKISSQYYKYKLTSPILRLAMNINEMDDNVISKRYYQKEFNILSICRMEFTLKGYVIGLIKTFASLCSKYNNLTLTLIGDGPDFQKVIRVVNQLPLDIKNKVKLVGKVEYSQLTPYFNKANVFVGMGTTILDAANTGLISIVEEAFVMKDITLGYFHSNPKFIGRPYVKGDKRNKETYNLIEEIYNLTFEQYYQYSVLTYNKCCKIYDINNVMNKLETLAKDKKHGYSLYNLFLYSIIDKIDLR